MCCIVFDVFLLSLFSASVDHPIHMYMCTHTSNIPYTYIHLHKHSHTHTYTHTYIETTTKNIFTHKHSHAFNIHIHTRIRVRDVVADQSWGTFDTLLTAPATSIPGTSTGPPILLHKQTTNKRGEEKSHETLLCLCVCLLPDTAVAIGC